MWYTTKAFHGFGRGVGEETDWINEVMAQWCSESDGDVVVGWIFLHREKNTKGKEKNKSVQWKHKNRWRISTKWLKELNQQLKWLLVYITAAFPAPFSFTGIFLHCSISVFLQNSDSSSLVPNLCLTSYTLWKEGIVNRKADVHDNSYIENCLLNLNGHSRKKQNKTKLYHRLHHMLVLIWKSHESENSQNKLALTWFKKKKKKMLFF